MKPRRNYPALGFIALLLSAISTVVRADTPMLIGINQAGAEFSHTNMPGILGQHYWYPRAADADYAKAVGAEIVRVPFRWERIIRAPNGVFDANFSATDIALLDAAIGYYEERGIKVVLDMHNFGAARLTINGVMSTYAIGTPQVPTSEYARAWRMLADRYKNRTSIWGYDIMNEPGGTIAAWMPIAQAAVNAIREVDTKHAIILEGAHASSASQWQTHGQPLLTGVVDPSDNLVYSPHCYPDYGAGGSFNNGVTVSAELVRPDRYDDLASALNVGEDRIKYFVDWCVANNVRGLVGEYGIPNAVDTANWNIVLDRMLAYIKNNGNGLISATQWAYGVADHPALSQRRDNSIPPQIPAVWPSYVSGVGTNYWTPFRWYDENLSVTADYAFGYTFASPSPAATCSLVLNDTSGPYAGTNAIKLQYMIPAGGWAGAGMHIRGPLTAGGVGGMDVSRNVAAGHVLSFYAKGTPGATPSIAFASTSNASGVDSGADTVIGPAVSIAGIAPLTGSWQRYEVPLSALVNATLAAKNRVQRIRLMGSPANGATYDVYLDRIMIEASTSNTAPAVTVNTSTGGSVFNAGQSVTLVATATDANPGDSIDYVEFYSNNTKVGIDEASPYQFVTAFGAAGTYEVKAIAFDSHGVVKQSAIKTLTITSGTTVSFQSVAADDGHVFETTETSNTGGTTSSVTNILYVGDNAARCQVKSVVSFDTASIPDGATITSVTLKLRRASITGGNPFTTHGTCNVSIRSGGYSGNANLVAGDFASPDTASNVASLPAPASDGAWTTASLNAAGIAAINKTGKTQLKISFATDDDNDAVADAINFSSGNDATAANRPVLEVIYQ